jgi:parallel beta-helix repeat protein
MYKMSTRRKVIVARKTKVLYAVLLVVGIIFWCAAGEARTINVNCATGGSITTAVQGASPWDTIVVSGTCNESVYIGSSLSYLTIDGQGSATIQNPDPNAAVIVDRTDNVTIKGLNITGSSLSPEVGIVVVSGSARIDGNHISNNYIGVVVRDSGSTVIVNNTIEQNAQSGILIQANSFARIGLVFPFDTAAQPNTIQNNGQGAPTTGEAPGGVTVVESSSAQIIGNTIRDNTGDGITVDGVSQAICADNDISGNRNGIFVSKNSGVVLTRNPAGSSIFDTPNTSTVRNHSWGIYCSVGACVVGRRGTLAGFRRGWPWGSNTVYSTSGCIDQTTP